MPPAALTVIANLALDRVNGGAWTPGGCPTFAPAAFAALAAQGTIVTACAAADRDRFAGLLDGDPPVDLQFIEAAETNRFTLDYRGQFSERRAMAVPALGHAWSEADIDALAIETDWVHLAPLLRSDFPVATVARLAARGHRVSYDGQGLVRVPQPGPLTLDGDYDRALLRSLTALKLSDEELSVLVAQRERDAVLAELSAVPELLLTEDFRGAEVIVAGRRTQVRPPHVVDAVESTGAGDTFMIGYGVARSRGADPVDAARTGAEVAARMLLARKRGGNSTTLV